MNSLSASAYHESGHVVLAVRLGRKVGDVRIANDGSGSASTYVIDRSQRNRLSQKEWASQSLREATICLAGQEAERRVAGAVDAAACAVDTEQAKEWIRASGSCMTIDDVRRRAAELLNEPATWRSVKRLAVRLLLHGTATADEVRRAFSEPIVRTKRRLTTVDAATFDRYYENDGRPRPWWRAQSAKYADANRASRARTLAFDSMAEAHSSWRDADCESERIRDMQAAYDRCLRGDSDYVPHVAGPVNDIRAAAERTKRYGLDPANGGRANPAEHEERLNYFRRTSALDRFPDREVRRLFDLQELYDAARKGAN